MLREWISPWWQAALLPDKMKVCGAEVYPLSVWHTFALENLANHYLIGGGCDRDDAVGLLTICRLRYRDRLQLFGDIRCQRQALVEVGCTLAAKEWTEVDAACVEYVAQCMRTVSRFTPQGGGGKPAAAPYQWHLVSLLSGNDPSRLPAAWDTPYAVARCLYDAFAESKGDTSLLSVAAQKMEDEWIPEPAEVTP